MWKESSRWRLCFSFCFLVLVMKGLICRAKDIVPLKKTPKIPVTFNVVLVVLLLWSYRRMCSQHFLVLFLVYNEGIGFWVAEINTQNHRMSGGGRDLCGSSSPPPCRSRVAYSRLHRTLSRQVLNISREGDSTTSLGSLCQGSTTLRGKKFFLMFRRNFLCFSLCPLTLIQLVPRLIWCCPHLFYLQVCHRISFNLKHSVIP